MTIDNKEKYQQIKKELKKDIPQLEYLTQEIQESFATILISHIQKRPKTGLPFWDKLFNFQLNIVIDNNILYATIYGLIKGNKNLDSCFFHQLAIHPSVNFYAPHFIQKEIKAKINAKFKEEDQPKALTFAETLLSAITIKDAQWIDDWQKAKKKIGHIDLDDVPYLALCFDINSHGIMSNDKIFTKGQNDFKVWNIQETGELTNEYSEGIISYFLLNQYPNLISIVYNHVRSFFIAILETVSFVSKIAMGIMEHGVTYLAKINPKYALLFAGLLGIAYTTIDGVKEVTNNGLKKIQTFLAKLIENLKVFYQKIKNFTLQIIEMITPYIKGASTFTAYLGTSTLLAFEHVNEMNTIET